MRPENLAEVATRTATDGDWDHHLRGFLDTFYAADGDGARQGALIADRPALTGEDVADAILGGAAEHLARRWTLPIPRWVREHERYLLSALFWPDDPTVRPYLFCVSPVAFRTRLIFTGPDPLQRARFPYHRGVIRLPLDFPASREG